MNRGRPGSGQYYGGSNRRGGRRDNGGNQNTVIILLTVVIVVCLAAVAVMAIVLFGSTGTSAPSVTTAPPVTTDAPVTDTPVTTEDPGAAVVPTDTALVVDSATVSAGELILVNAAHPFVFPAGYSAKMQTFYGNKSSSYKVAYSDTNILPSILKTMNTMFDDMKAQTELSDIQITSGFRSYDLQKELYERYVTKYGEDYAANYAALPGNSEHHTGYAFDCNVIVTQPDKTTKSYTLVQAISDLSDKYQWIYDNCAKYGFTLRYPASKTDITGINYENWHFRYVGIPHAEIMAANNLCLEEYLSLLQDYTYEKEHLYFTASNGKSYEIYYIPIPLESTGDGANGLPTYIYTQAAKTTLWVPTDAKYTVSGDNYSGFIITVEK